MIYGIIDFQMKWVLYLLQFIDLKYKSHKQFRFSEPTLTISIQLMVILLFIDIIDYSLFNHKKDNLSALADNKTM